MKYYRLCLSLFSTLYFLFLLLCGKVIFYLEISLNLGHLVSLKNHTFIGNLAKTSSSSGLIDSYLKRTLFPSFWVLISIFSSNIDIPHIFFDRMCFFSMFCFFTQSYMLFKYQVKRMHLIHGKRW